MGILTMENAKQKVEQALDLLRRGKMIIVTDDKDRENEGDLVCLARDVSTQAIDFMTRKGRGLICASLGPEIVTQLTLETATGRNTSPFATPFTESLDIRVGITTGIAAEERAATLRHLADPSSKREDFTTPGHVFPLAAHPEGLFGRRGHTEAAVELARLCGSVPAAVICEILGEGSGMARGKELADFARKENLFCLALEELFLYLYKPIETVQMPLAQGEFTLSLYPKLSRESGCPMVLRSSGSDHSAQNLDDGAQSPVPVRIHSSCSTGDVFGSLRCDCGRQLEDALKIIGREGGVLIYLQQEGRGIGLVDKMRAYRLQEKGVDTLEANLLLGHPVDSRDYSAAIRILRAESLFNVELLTNNPQKVDALKNAGFRVKRRPLIAESNKYNRNYLQTKRKQMGHLLEMEVKN